MEKTHYLLASDNGAKFAMNSGKQQSEKELGQAPEALTFWQAIKDLGFISWLFATIVGAPSIVSLVQTVFIDVQFTALLQWLIDGYNQLLLTITVILNPLAARVLSLAEELLNIPLELQRHWQPLFVLLAIFISSNTRSLIDDGYMKPAIVFAPVMLVFALAGAWTAGVVPASAIWWMQGVAVSVPIFLLFVGMFISYQVAWMIFGFSQPYRKPLLSYLKRGLTLALAAFFIAAVMSSTSLIDAHSGLLTLFLGMAVYGSFWIREGFSQNDIPEIRFGLRLVGGFVFAVALLGLDAGLNLFI